MFAMAVFSGCTNVKKDVPKTAESQQPEIREIRFPTIQKGIGGTEKKILATNIAEDLTIQLTPRLKQIGLLLRGIECGADQVLAKEGTYLGLEAFEFKSAMESLDQSGSIPVKQVQWPLAEKPTQGIDTEMLWHPLTKLHSFEEAQFGIVSTELLEEESVLRMKTSFEGRFHDDATKHVYGVKSYQIIDWSIVDNDWKISSWQQKSFKIGRSSSAFFTDVTASVVKSEDAFKTLSQSPHRAYLIKRLAEKKAPPKHKSVRELIPDWESAFQYTSVSVFDYDNDGIEDLLVVDRAAEPVLLRNSGDDQFEDVTESAGLKNIGATGNCALLFDFDNDGDSDLMIGRSIDSALFFRNDDGKFVAHEQVNELLKDVKFVTSGSVCDINRDGLLDVYLCTYAAGGTDPKFAKYIVPESQQMRLENLVKKGHPFTNRGGPPNVVLMNNGSGFDRAKLPSSIEQWRHSYQASWTDYDSDGDQDLYVCNDFSPDAFLRNDTPKGGDPKFTNVAKEILPGEMGFGMGASFGDYNSDGLIDLYVSNMYSKAGNRIFNQLGGSFDPRLRMSAQGNFLLKNNGGKFEQVAGTDPDSQHVSKVGWSFGGQMLDLNNDSKLDVYVPSGYFTAPEISDSKVDL